MKNEKGYALILVLLIATVTMIFALSLSGLALTTRTQLNKTDNNIKATALAEMGITYYQSLVIKKVNVAKKYAENIRDNYNGKNKDDKFNDAQLDAIYNQEFKEKLDELLNISLPPVNVDTEENTFKITFITLDKQANNKLVLNFDSLGQANEDSVELTGYFTIEKTSTTDNEPQPTQSYYSIIETKPVNLVNQPKQKTNNSSTYFSKEVVIQGKRLLTVHGDAYFKDLNLQGSASLNIYGDAIFEKEINNVGEAYKICITGKAHKLNSTNTLEDYPLTKNQCSTPIDSDWVLNTNTGTKIIY